MVLWASELPSLPSLTPICGYSKIVVPGLGKATRGGVLHFWVVVRLNHFPDSDIAL